MASATARPGCDDGHGAVLTWDRTSGKRTDDGEKEERKQESRRKRDSGHGPGRLGDGDGAHSSKQLIPPADNSDESSKERERKSELELDMEADRYSSLEQMLERNGFKKTRVATPDSVQLARLQSSTSSSSSSSSASSPATPTPARRHFAAKIQSGKPAPGSQARTQTAHPSSLRPKSSLASLSQLVSSWWSPVSSSVEFGVTAASSDQDAQAREGKQPQQSEEDEEDYGQVIGTTVVDADRISSWIVGARASTELDRPCPPARVSSEMMVRSDSESSSCPSIRLADSSASSSSSSPPNSEVATPPHAPIAHFAFTSTPPRNGTSPILKDVDAGLDIDEEDMPTPTATRVLPARRQESAASALGRNLRHAVSDSALRQSTSSTDENKAWSYTSAFSKLLSSAFPPIHTLPQRPPLAHAKVQDVFSAPVEIVVEPVAPPPPIQQQPRLLRKTASQATLRKRPDPVLSTHEAVVKAYQQPLPPDAKAKVAAATAEPTPAADDARNSRPTAPDSPARALNRPAVVRKFGRAGNQTPPRPSNPASTSNTSPEKRAKVIRGPPVVGRRHPIASNDRVVRRAPAQQPAASTSQEAQPARPRLRAKESLEYIRARENARLEAQKARQQTAAGRRALTSLSSFAPCPPLPSPPPKSETESEGVSGVAALKGIWGSFFGSENEATAEDNAKTGPLVRPRNQSSASTRSNSSGASGSSGQRTVIPGLRRVRSALGPSKPPLVIPTIVIHKPVDSDSSTSDSESD